MINTTLAEQESDGHWDGSQYSFGSPVYFTSIQITLLNQILKLYQGHRTNEITASIEKAKAWTNSNYHTEVLDGKVCGYFGDTIDLENAIFAGILCASQTGLVSADVDMTFQSLVDNIAAYIPGDVNQDGKTDMKDVAMVVRAFGTRLGDPLWNPANDITGSGGLPDGRIDMRDVSLVVRHFGESSP